MSHKKKIGNEIDSQLLSSCRKNTRRATLKDYTLIAYDVSSKTICEMKTAVTNDVLPS